MKFGYDGVVFHGLARQPGLRTVEGEIVKALTGASALRDVRSSRFQSASRTDRGVSALGNVVAFDSQLAPIATVRAFNRKARGVWAWAVADVVSSFNPRHARERWYEYALPGTFDEGRLGEALRTFIGEHDFRNFTRGRERSVLRIDKAAARRKGNAIVLEFRAPRFAWNLVRRFVAAALFVESGTGSVRDLEKALEPGTRLDFGLAPPEPLVLVDVSYDFGFVRVWDPTTEERVHRILADRLRDASLYGQLADRFEKEESGDR
jgi:tRNA pseudouridine38-40 synthase